MLLLLTEKFMTGIILFDKPEGITSFGAVARIR